ncbi:MAG: hypothetical protein KTR28_08845 [Micavibrio sp.]|nr:hypothetical protein [Micavibrio sp.]
MTVDLERHIEHLISCVDEAHIALKNNTVVDLGTLENDVNAVCDLVSHLPPERARALQPLMADLIARLDVLAEDLQNFKARYKDQ